MKHLFFCCVVVAAVSTASCASSRILDVLLGPPVAGAGSAGAGVAASTASEASDYVIGPEDVLTVVFWRDKEISGEVVVRPDGQITLPLLNDIPAAGYTPAQLRLQLIEAASKFLEEPDATVLVKTINSRRVFITGNVSKPGIYPLPSTMTILQLIAAAGGLPEYADSENILILRSDSGTTQRFKFDYKDVAEGKNLQQNILLKPGDTVIVP